MKKITLLIYTAVIAITGLCALVFPQYVKINIDSCVPLAVTGGSIFVGLLMTNNLAFFNGSKLRIIGRRGDFKYSKNEKGESVFTESDFYRAPISKEALRAIGYVFLLTAAAIIPFIVFFSMKTKWLTLGLLFIPLTVGAVIGFVSDAKQSRAIIAEQRAREAQWKKELEEQKKREEMGRWK